MSTLIKINHHVYIEHSDFSVSKSLCPQYSVNSPDQVSLVVLWIFSGALANPAVIGNNTSCSPLRTHSAVALTPPRHSWARSPTCRCGPTSLPATTSTVWPPAAVTWPVTSSPGRSLPWSCMAESPATPLTPVTKFTGQRSSHIGSWADDRSESHARRLSW